MNRTINLKDYYYNKRKNNDDMDEVEEVIANMLDDISVQFEE